MKTTLYERLNTLESHFLSEYTTGPLSQAMYETLRTLRQAGIVDFWEKVPIAIRTRRTNTNLDIAATDEERAMYDSGMAYMNHTLVSLAHLFAGMAVLTLLCLAAEILYPKMKERWDRYMERRRFRRAIWHLGKI